MKSDGLKPDGQRRKFLIIIEDDGQGRFNLWCEGAERIGKVPTDSLGAAEYWGSKLFEICVNAVKKTGAIDSVRRKGEQ